MIKQKIPEQTEEMTLSPTVEALIAENQRLLDELELAYKNLECVLEQTEREKEIAYSELQEKFIALENMYTQLSQKENLLIHMEKLSSIGQFISEIVHELSNPLMIISGHAELALQMNPSEGFKDFFQVIYKNAQLMSDYLMRFRKMAYKGTESFKDFDLNKVVLEALETIQILKPKTVSIKIELETEALTVNGDPYQIIQIFLNLAKNAFDAMKESGNFLLITSRRVSREWLQQSNEFSPIHCQSPEIWEKIISSYPHFALIEIIDNGSGINPKHLKNIFHAFFTTKPRGKGTGLGLSISSDIIRRMGGNLAVKSQKGVGTTFQLILPIVSLAKTTCSSSTTPGKNKKTI